jgi:hypothetical protein
MIRLWRLRNKEEDLFVHCESIGLSAFDSTVSELFLIPEPPQPNSHYEVIEN